ncbi:MAG: ATP-grasp domain-containing protein [Candidatus Sulfotelmatobacter sp.]
MARILVLDGHSGAALAAARAAGMAGHWVTVGANRGLFAAAKLSRYCRLGFDYPVSTEDTNAFVDSIVEFVRAHTIDLVIPVTDWTLGPISQQRHRFAGLCRVAMPSQAALDAVSDKYGTIRLAGSLGISVPRTMLAKSTEDLEKWETPQFPLVVKDRFSVRWIKGNAVFGSVAYAYSAEDLRKLVAQRLQLAGDVLIQEFVSGVGIGVSCFVAGEKTYLPFQWQRIREIDPRGSGSSARKSIPLSPPLVSLSAKLITTMGFEGLAMVEYKKANDGRLILMEINGRPWGSIGLPIACGIDYFRHLIDWCLEEKLPPDVSSYRENIICRRAVAELTHLSALRTGRPANWPIPYPNFWTSLVAMSVPWHPGMCYDDVWLSDMRPGIAGITNWFQSRIKKKFLARR